MRLVAGLAVTGPRMGIPFGDVAADAAHLDGARGHPLRALCLSSAAWSACLRGDFDKGIPLSDESLGAGPVPLDGDREALRVRSEALTVAWSVRVIQGDPGGAASALLEENIDVARALGDPYYVAHALLEQSGRSALEECVRLAHLTANPSTLAYALTLLATQVVTEDAPRAKTLLDEAISYAASVNNEQAGALARSTLTMVLPPARWRPEVRRDGRAGFGRTAAGDGGALLWLPTDGHGGGHARRPGCRRECPARRCVAHRQKASSSAPRRDPARSATTRQCGSRPS